MRKVLLLAFAILFSVELFAQVVTGIVKDPDGNPLAGATIEEKGVTSSTLSGADGKFTIKLHNGNVIRVSVAGYNPVEIQVVEGKEIEIVLTKKTFRRVELGLKAGFDVNWGDYEANYYVTEGVSLGEVTTTQFNGGVYLDINLTKVFAFETGVMYYQRQINGELNLSGYLYSYPVSYDMNGKFHYLSFPLLCKWNIRLGRCRLYFLFGPLYEVVVSDKIGLDSYQPVTVGDNAFPDKTFGVLLGEGFEFPCKIGFRFGTKAWADVNSGDEIDGAGLTFETALTYRF